MFDELQLACLTLFYSVLSTVDVGATATATALLLIADGRGLEKIIPRGFYDTALVLTD